MTLDVNTLLDTLLDTYGESIHLMVRPMTVEERHAAERDIGPVVGVVERFNIVEQCEDTPPIRRRDLEERIVERGQK